MNFELSNCNLCPRACGVNRTAGISGFCLESDVIHVARASLHMWEEPCISGEVGSGTVFFSGCSLKCVFCQNNAISRGRVGKYISVRRLADIFMEQQGRGAANINLVTPTHYVPQIIEAIKLARINGLEIPIVYNTGGYETVDTIKALEPYVDVWLPDFKYISPELSQKYSGAGDYAEYAKPAIDEMVRQVKAKRARGYTEFDEHDMMKCGVVVRHLMLPGCMEDSKAVIRYLYETYGDDIYISIMNQYTPMPGIGEKYPELSRTITEEEYDELVDYAIDLGVENGFIQEGETASSSFIPDFDCSGVDPEN